MADIEELRKRDFIPTYRELESIFRRESSMREWYKSVYSAAYILLRIKQDKTLRYDSCDSFLTSSGTDNDQSIFLKDNRRQQWDDIIIMKDRLREDDLKALLLFCEPFGRGSDGDSSTPMGVAKLVTEIAAIKNGDKVADFFTGRGSIFRECLIRQPKIEIYANDTNIDSVQIAKFRAQLLGGSADIEHEDVIDMKKFTDTFDVAFASYPFGLKLRNLRNNSPDRYEKLIAGYPEFRDISSMDWAFNRKVFDSVKDDGRAICIMTTGSAQGAADLEARRYFAERGEVEAVIALPENLFPGTAVATMIIVFSHGNENVMMVDARKMFTEGRRCRTLTDDDITEILNALHEEGKCSKKVSCAELAENSYALNPVRYTRDVPAISDGIEFGQIIRNVTRGTPLTAHTLDELSTTEDTGIDYLMLVNIRDGIIDDELVHLKSIDKGQERYCIRNNSLIISKNGPFKFAVCEVPKGRRVIASGNLLVIEIDEERADPYYIKAFLESSAGAAAFDGITVGSVIPNIALDELRRMIVPCPPIEKQRAVAARYRQIIDEVRRLRKDLKGSLDNLKRIYEDSLIF